MLVEKRKDLGHQRALIKDYLISMLIIRFAVLVSLGLVPLSAGAAGSAGIPIEHVIFIIQENHSFDNYFGTYPQANGIPAGTKLAEFPGGPLVRQPFLTSAKTIPRDLPHTFLAARVAYHDGAMDGFLWSEFPAGYRYYGRGIPVPTPDPKLVKTKPKGTQTAHGSVRLSEEALSPHGFADDEDADAPEIEEQNDAAASAELSKNGPPKGRPSWSDWTISYVDYNVIPNYWEYARKFTLCDAFFSSLSGPSQPNHLYAVAAQSGGLANNLPLREAAIYSFPSVIELLGNAQISWKYYSGQKPSVESLWTPLPGFKEYANDPSLMSHLASTETFLQDIKNGHLPQVCWITPSLLNSEHPPQNIQNGMWYVTGLINAVMQSSYWANCAIIVAWDDYGGFYDHVPPIQTDKFGFGFRVPALVISPYSRSGAVIHTTYDLTSPLKLIETKFGLSSLTARDGSSNTMLECFDFTQQPLPPDIIEKTTKLDFSEMPPSKPNP